jgi:ATP-dependent Lhr-like helicase
MLVSVNVDHGQLFEGLQAVVVDEVHAFAGDDRGWHLLAVLERLTHLIGRPVQRVGLSATVGNPAELLGWLQGVWVTPTTTGSDPNGFPLIQMTQGGTPR